MTGTLHFPGDVGADLDRLLTLIETAHEHGDETAIVEQAAKLRAALTPSPCPGDVGTVALQNCIGSILEVIEPLLKFHETGGHEGNGSDKQLAKIRTVLSTPIGKLPALTPSALSGDAGEVERLRAALEWALPYARNQATDEEGLAAAESALTHQGAGEP